MITSPTHFLSWAGRKRPALWTRIWPALFAATAAFTFASVAQAQAATTPPSAPTLPVMNLDRLGDDVGVAQTTALARDLQARILWMDAGANVGYLNSPDKIKAIVAKVKASGINMIVLDVKPIVGYTVYPSKFAPRLTDWKGAHVDPSLDVLAEMLADAHAVGIPVYANISTFGEGHKTFKLGPAYTHTDWQTVLYEQDRTVFAGYSGEPILASTSLPATGGGLASVTDGSLLHQDLPGCAIAVLNFNARVEAVYDGAYLSSEDIHLPVRGSALIGRGDAGRWLAQHAAVGQTLIFTGTPKYVPVVDAPEQVYTVFCDPNNTEVRQHEWDIVREIVTNYNVDGIVFDDRLRYAGLNADFGPGSRAAFEAVVGKKLTWPDDVFRLSPLPGGHPIPGPYYNRWLSWRAGVITSWLAQAAQIVRSIRPQAQVAVYVGSWYGDYDEVASNWAGPDFDVPYPWMTPDYRSSAYAGLLDWLTTGCYYYQATMTDGVSAGVSPGATVEGAGEMSNLVVADSAWTYGGIYALSYKGNPNAFSLAMRAAAASTQGVMIFDMSQIIQYDWWNLMADAFNGSPAQAPNTVPGLLEQVRAQSSADRARGVPRPVLPPFVGFAGTGW